MSKQRTRTVSLRLTEEQYQWLNDTAQFISNKAGTKVTRASVIMRLMERGLPYLEQELRSLRSNEYQSLYVVK